MKEYFKIMLEFTVKKIKITLLNMFQMLFFFFPRSFFQCRSFFLLKKIIKKNLTSFWKFDIAKKETTSSGHFIQLFTTYFYLHSASRRTKDFLTQNGLCKLVNWYETS